MSKVLTEGWHDLAEGTGTAINSATEVTVDIPYIWSSSCSAAPGAWSDQAIEPEVTSDACMRSCGSQLLPHALLQCVTLSKTPRSHCKPRSWGLCDITFHACCKMVPNFPAAPRKLQLTQLIVQAHIGGMRTTVNVNTKRYPSPLLYTPLLMLMFIHCY